MSTEEDFTIEGLVHDLNNVFETISDASDLLEQDPKWTGLAQAIHRSVLRGRRIVESISTSVRDEQDFNDILDNSIEFARDLFKAVRTAPVSFERCVEPEIRLRGNQADWERILLNLFVNAAQAMQQGGVVAVSAKRDAGEVTIEVTDDGSGIPPAILPKIFEPHFSTKSAKSGLGLHIVASLVRQNGGSVSARNRDASHGACFRIRVPAA